MSAFDRFLLWEQTTRDTIDFKTIYVDMADDLIAGLVLSQIVYWHLPNDKGQSKLRVQKDGYLWIAKRRTDWYDEIRVSAKQADRALKILEDREIIVTCLHRFDGAPTVHIRINHAGFLSAWHFVLSQRDKSILPKGENQNEPLGEFQFDQKGNSLTETVTETPTQTTTGVLGASAPKSSPPTPAEALCLELYGEDAFTESDLDRLKEAERVDGVTKVLPALEWCRRKDITDMDTICGTAHRWVPRSNGHRSNTGPPQGGQTMMDQAQALLKELEQNGRQAGDSKTADGPDGWVSSF